ncbi:hypothetical protein H109_04324 [Trichophyton interdigitale MR816]|uniref:LYR motif-containing protein Cup1-like N-terminal domain-containing protein n=1 Tax=Trichophyton interdigitale (strain MR816) TaxID=1215338 RepID=A0A059J8G8_TRIIM|nr:hypothetical protein H101_01894 [Trichophyton interdigitale H6]KDB23762.1 hypothetical protein H109_04324 [Trichophyton interdigitale MR816]
MATTIPWKSHYRALLREASYLPDPVAKRYMAEYITSRYRKFTSREQQKSMNAAKIARLHTRIKKNMKLLQHANKGYTKSLERVLLMSYGRIGRRKRILLRPFLQSGPGSKAAFSQHWRPSELLLALLQSQSENSNIGAQKVKRPVRTTDLEPRIPELNALARPLADIRKIHIRQKWYAHVLDKTFPPLPQHDWETLQRLVEGSEPWTPPVRRKGSSEITSVDSTSASEQSYLSTDFLIKGATKDPTFAQYVRGRPHQITRRLMRHMWERICALTPLIQWDSSKNKWWFSWGVRQPPAPIYRQVDPVKGLALFEGVHQKTGRVIISRRQSSKPGEGDKTQKEDWDKPIEAFQSTPSDPGMLASANN